MTAFKSLLPTAAALTMLALTITACGGDSSDTSTTASSTAPSSSAAAASADTHAASPEDTIPTAEDLNAILFTATDPEAPLEAKVLTVQGGEQAPELFETMTESKRESGAVFEVVPPVLPGYTPDSVLTVVKYSLPDQEPQTVKDVEFIYEDGTWKLSQSWACTLINSAVAPEKVPAMCQDMGTAPVDAPAPAEAPAPAN